MSTIKIASRTATFSANSAGTHYVLDHGSRLASSGIGIEASKAVAGRSFEIDGEIKADLYGILVGLPGEHAASTTVVIGETGYIHSTHDGLNANTDDSTYIIKGSIVSDGAAVYLQGEDNTVLNSGSLNSSSNAVSLRGNGNVLTNTGTITGAGGVFFNLQPGEHAKLINSGLLSSSSVTIAGSTGKETVVNSGKIFGQVDLGSGEDTFISKGGTVTGPIYGAGGKRPLRDRQCKASDQRGDRHRHRHGKGFPLLHAR